MSVAVEVFKNRICLGANPRTVYSDAVNYEGHLDALPKRTPEVDEETKAVVQFIKELKDILDCYN